MKRITCDFGLLRFDDSTLLLSYHFTPALLSAQVGLFGAQAGSGKNTQTLLIPEAAFYFRDVAFCERTTRALGAKKGLFLEPISVREDLPEITGGTHLKFTLSGKMVQPPGLAQWDIRARAFEMELGDDILGQLSEAGLNFQFC